MNREVISVPAGVRYISDWEKLEGGYSLKNYLYPHIINKQITGCGFTEYCLTNQFNVILCSPRKILLENKEEQHHGEVFYARSVSDKVISFDIDFTKIGTAKVAVDKLSEDANQPDPNLVKEDELSLHRRLREYYFNCVAENRPCKILVTYDSFRHVADALRDYLPSFYVVVDEFQSIFVDSRFKSSTESEFMWYLKGIRKLCFVSATPMIDKYLEMLDEFKDLPYYEFDWASEDPGRIVKPRLEVRAVKSITPEVSRIISEYKNGEFRKYSFRDEGGNIREIESREAVFYVNSVENIKNIISRNGLTQEECNVLCARTPQNEEKIRKAFKVGKKAFHGLGTVPKKGQPHKMFTFCTRTVYLGADFYSTNARSFIFSDANIDSLAVDVTLDLPQILGRQRLDINPWKTTAELYFRPTLAINAVSEAELDRILAEKIEKTNKLLDAVSSLGDESLRSVVLEKYEDSISVTKYARDYTSVNRHTGSSPVPVFNNLVMIAERRAFDIQQIDYKDRFMVMKAISKFKYDVEVDKLNEALMTFDSLGNNFIDKMKFLCTCGNGNFDEETIRMMLPSIPLTMANYYNVLGPERIISLSCQNSMLSEEYDRLVGNQSKEGILREAILEEFPVGSRRKVKDIKISLIRVYDRVGHSKSAKATDLQKYVNLRRCIITNPETKQKEEGFEILSIKQ